MSSPDILTQEYAESVVTEIKETSSHSIDNIETKIHGDRQYFQNANAIRLSTHSKLDEKIRSA